MIRANWIRAAFAVAVISAVLGALAVTQSAHAATTYTVNTTADSVDSGGCVTVSTCSLRDAVIAADAAGSGTISVPAGTYTLSIASGAGDDPTNGDLDITNDADVTINGAGQGSTIIDANQIDRAFAVQSGATLDLSGATIDHGLANLGSTNGNDSGEYGSTGGAIYSDGTLAISDVTIEHSSANDGGAIYADEDAVDTSITDSTLSGNEAGFNDNGYGGAVDLEGGTLEVTDSTFSADSTDEAGGAIEADGADATITGSTFSGDSALDGGAIDAEDSPTTISTSTFSADAAAGASFFCDSSVGGAIFDEADASLSIDSSLFSGDSAGDQGGAISYGGGGRCVEAAPARAHATPAAAPDPNPDLTITNSEITGSSAADGGALYSDVDWVLTIDDSTIDHNTAPADGGGIYVDDTANGSTIEGSTISDNTAGGGAGLFFDLQTPIQFTNDTIADNTAGDDANVNNQADGGGIAYPANADSGDAGGYVNTIVADNTGGDCTNPGDSGAASDLAGAADQGNNIDSDASCFSPSAGGAVVKAHVQESSASLELGPLQDNGGQMVGAPGDEQPLLTQLPGATSSAIGAGSSAACTGADERGTPETGGCDAGSVKVAPAVLSIADTAQANATANVPFNDDITISNAGPAPSGQTVLTFTIPANETFYGASPAQGTCSTSGSTVTCDLGDIDSGASTALTLVVAANTGGSFTNSVSATNVEGNTATGSASTQVTSSSPGGGSSPVTNTVTTSVSTTVTNTVTNTTPAVNMPTAVTGTASHLTLTGSTVSGEVTTGGGASTSYFFEYGTTTHYGYVTPVQTTTDNLAVTEKLSGLTAGTVYHYRLIAINAEGKATGSDRTFKTAGTTFLGDLLLDSNHLLVSDGEVEAKFTCESSFTCVFRWAVTTNAEIGTTGRYGPALVTSGANPPVSIAAHGTRTISYRATKAGLALLAQQHDQLQGRLTSRPLSHQGGLIKVVHLH